MSSLRIGLLAEDETDCDTVKVLIHRLLDPIRSESSRVDVKRRYGNGASKLRRSAERWMKQLADEGCSVMIVLHDLDRDPVSGDLNEEAELRSRLTVIPVPRAVSRYVCIPIEELEAWFWSDIRVLQKIGPKSARASLAPETIKKPKEELRHLSARDRGRHWYSTNLNEELAKELDLDVCGERCATFRGLRDFLLGLLPDRNRLVSFQPASESLAREHGRFFDASDCFGSLASALTRGVQLEGRHVVEIGCGTGSVTAWLVDQGATVTGIDRSGAMLAVAKERLGERLDSVDLLPEDARGQLSVGGGVADLVILDGILGTLCLERRDGWNLASRRVLDEMERLAVAGAVLVVVEMFEVVDERPPELVGSARDIDAMLSERGYSIELLRADCQFGSSEEAVAVVRAVLGESAALRVRNAAWVKVPVHAAVWMKRRSEEGRLDSSPSVSDQ